jgi:hypothetical protein
VANEVAHDGGKNNACCGGVSSTHEHRKVRREERSTTRCAQRVLVAHGEEDCERGEAVVLSAQCPAFEFALPHTHRSQYSVCCPIIHAANRHAKMQIFET